MRSPEPGVIERFTGAGWSTSAFTTDMIINDGVANGVRFKCNNQHLMVGFKKQAGRVTDSYPAVS